MQASQRLPAPLSSFVGRQAEVAEVSSLIGRARLVTVTGLGGSGKSRLALAVAQRIRPSFPGGVWWVPLGQDSEAANGAGAAAAVTCTCGTDTRMPASACTCGTGARMPASACTCVADSRMPAAVLPGRPGTSRALLVFDGCEHAVDPVAQTVEELLVGSPNLRVLTTSQRRLGVPGELSWAIPPLSTPAGPIAGPDVYRYESVRLFLDRAAGARCRFDLDEQDAATIGTVCRRLEGIPLAIELAAARTGVLSLRQIAARLDDPVRLLVGGPRTAAARHRSLRATMDRSHALLDESERRLFAELSLFAGTFDLDAVEAVHQPYGDSQPIDVLAALVDCSLVTVIPAGRRARYRLPEPVRRYALGQLVARGALEAASARYARYRAGLAQHGDTCRSGTPDADPARTAASDAPPGRTPVRVTGEPTRLRIQALGAARVHRGPELLEPSAWTYAKPRELLYFLLSHPNATKERIGAALWPSASPAKLRTSFHTTLHHLRGALGDPSRIIYRHGGYAFNRACPYEYDVEVLEAGLARSNGDDPAALPYLVAAVEAYQGDFLPDLPGEQWIDARRAELRTAFEQVLLALGGRYARAGQFVRAVQVYQRAIRHDDLLELAHRELIRCYAGMGEQARALRHYNTLVTLLHDQLGILPSAETRGLYLALRGGITPPAPPPRESPRT